jgi:hypothetical protein
MVDNEDNYRKRYKNTGSIGRHGSEDSYSSHGEEKEDSDLEGFVETDEVLKTSEMSSTPARCSKRMPKKATVATPGQESESDVVFLNEEDEHQGIYRIILHGLEDAQHHVCLLRRR